MKTKKQWISLIWVALMLIGCSSVQAAGEQSIPEPVIGTSSRIIAEGQVVPARFSSLSVQVPGQVVEVLVEAGQQVAVDDPLLRLERDTLDLAVQSAEQDVLAQEAALQRLKKGVSDAVIARADKANSDQIAQAQVVLAIKRLSLDQAQAQDPALAEQAVRARLNQLEAQIAQVSAQAPAPAVIAVEVEVERARIALEDVQDEYNKALDRPWEDQSIRDAWADQLEQVQLNEKAAQANLLAAQNAQRAHALSLQVLAAQVAEARTGLAQAVSERDSYTLTLDILRAEVEAAELHLGALNANDNPYRDPAAAEELAQAEALLVKARLQVESLKLHAEDHELRAPFAGTVVDIFVEPGDQATPGQVVLVLATLDRLEVQTTDLTELDVAGVSVGQAAQVRVDALPDRVLAGTVGEISLQGQDYRGDVVYTVVVVLEEIDPALRWGMTVEVGME